MYDSIKWCELHELHFSGCPPVTVTSYKQLLAIGDDKNNQVTNQVLLWDMERICGMTLVICKHLYEYYFWR